MCWRHRKLCIIAPSATKLRAVANTMPRWKGHEQGSKVLNFAMQDFLRDWSSHSRRGNRPILLDQARLDWFVELNRGLRDPLDDEAFKARIRQTTLELRQLAREIIAAASTQHPGLDAGRVLALLDGSAGEITASVTGEKSRGIS